MTTQYAVRVGSNCDVRIKFHDDETLPTDANDVDLFPREMGFLLQKGQGERKVYRSYDDASRSIVNEVRRKGFQIDEETLRITFEKDAWDQDYGAYQEVPGQNRPALTIDVDHRRRHPILAPLTYTAGVDATQDDFPARVSHYAEFGGSFYCCIAGRKIYKLTWAIGTAYWTEVFEHSNASAVLRFLWVHDGVLYCAAGETAVYCYSSDGSSWTESNRTTVDAYAEAFGTLGRNLHKYRVPSGSPVLHYQCLDGTNTGDSWSSVDNIGEGSHTIQQMVPMQNRLVFCKDNGFFEMDTEGNVDSLWPELHNYAEDGNGWHSISWNNHLMYPTLRGGLYAMRFGDAISIPPSSRVDRMLEILPKRHAIFSGRIRAMAGLPEYMFAEVQRPTDSKHRIVVLERIGERWIWRTLFDLDTTTSDELAISSDSTSGSVLWASANDDQGYKTHYWILAGAVDPLQDARSRFALNGTLYEPWLDMGCSNTDKSWESIHVKAHSTAACTINIKAWGEDGTQGINQDMSVNGRTSGTYRFFEGFKQKACRFEFELQTDDAQHTPCLISYMVEAVALPEPFRVWDFNVMADAQSTNRGMYQQKQLRDFIYYMREADYMLEFEDPYHDVWSVRPIPPPPVEYAGIYPRQDRLDEVFQMRLIQVRTVEWENVYGAGPSPPPPWPPQTFPGHVYGSATISGSLLSLFETENFMDASPNWTAIGTTGLPTTTALNDCKLILDPYPVSGGYKAWLWVRDQTSFYDGGNNYHTLYYSDNALGSDTTWSVVLNWTILQTLMPAIDPALSPQPAGLYFAQVEAYIGQEGYIGVLVPWNIGHDNLGLSAQTYYLWSTDRGTTWNSQLVHSKGTSGVYPYYMEIHQKTGKIYAISEPNPNGPNLYTSAVGSETSWSNVKDLGTHAGVDCRIWCPYLADEDIVYYYINGAAAIQKSVDGGSNFTATSIDIRTDVVMHGRSHDMLAHWDRNLFLWLDPGEDDCRRAADDLTTEEDLGSFPINILVPQGVCMNLLNDGIYQVGVTKNDGAGSPDGLYAYSSDDWITFTDRSGDLNTLVGSGARFRSMISDWSS